MIVPADGALARIAEQHGSGRQHLAAVPASVLKAAGHDDGKRHVGVLFFERAIVWA
jgi:hypothetical protein